jgi:hypothetical protein
VGNVWDKTVCASGRAAQAEVEVFLCIVIVFASLASVIDFACGCGRAERGAAFDLRPWHLCFGVYSKAISLDLLEDTSTSI